MGRSRKRDKAARSQRLRDKAVRETVAAIKAVLPRRKDESITMDACRIVFVEVQRRYNASLRRVLCQE